MRENWLWIGAVVALTFAAALPSRCCVAQSSGAASSAPALDDLFSGRVKLVDLAYSVNPHSAYWPGENYFPFELKTIATLEKDGVLSKSFSMPEHLGTHMDAPNHFEANQPAVDKVPAEQLLTCGVLIDVSLKAEMDPDYQLTLDDLQEWEKEHGPIPQRSVVLLKTGWGRFWNNKLRFQNRDARGKLHFPSFSAESARWLVEQRKINGVGVDTMSIDRGISQDFAVHHIVNGAGKYGLENVANLDQLPARGFYLIIAPIKIETGTGGVTRIWAVIPQTP